jgi:hypothetical protein
VLCTMPTHQTRCMGHPASWLGEGLGHPALWLGEGLGYPAEKRKGKLKEWSLPPMSNRNGGREIVLTLPSWLDRDLDRDAGWTTMAKHFETELHGA